jgi:hypothetical protein
MGRPSIFSRQRYFRTNDNKRFDRLAKLARAAKLRGAKTFIPGAREVLAKTNGDGRAYHQAVIVVAQLDDISVEPPSITGEMDLSKSYLGISADGNFVVVKKPSRGRDRFYAFGFHEEPDAAWAPRQGVTAEAIAQKMTQIENHVDSLSDNKRVGNFTIFYAGHAPMATHD